MAINSAAGRLSGIDTMQRDPMATALSLPAVLPPNFPISAPGGLELSSRRLSGMHTLAWPSGPQGRMAAPRQSHSPSPCRSSSVQESAISIRKCQGVLPRSVKCEILGAERVHGVPIVGCLRAGSFLWLGGAGGQKHGFVRLQL